MIAATLYCAIATFRTVAGLRSEDTVVIITQLPAAQAINATCDSPIETLFQRNRVSSISVSASSTYNSGNNHGNLPSGAQVALEVLLRRHLILLTRSEEDHQTRDGDDRRNAVLRKQLFEW